MRCTPWRSSASTAQATARKVLPVPAGPMPKVMSCASIWRRYCIWLGVRPARSAWRVCSTTGPSAGTASGRCSTGAATALARAPCSARSPIGSRAFSYSASSSSTALSTAPRGPSMRKLASRRARRTPSAASMARRWASSGPHRWARRRLSAASKVWRRITGVGNCARPCIVAARRRRAAGHAEWPIPCAASPCSPRSPCFTRLALIAWLALAGGMAAGADAGHPLGTVGPRRRLGLPRRCRRAGSGAARRMGTHAARLRRHAVVPRAFRRPDRARQRRPAGAVRRACLQQPGGASQRPAGAQRRAAWASRITHNCNHPQLVALPVGADPAGREPARHQGRRPCAGARWARTSAPAACRRWRSARSRCWPTRHARADGAAGDRAAGGERHAAADGRLHVRAGLHQPQRKPPGLLRCAVGGLGAHRCPAVAARAAGRQLDGRVPDRARCCGFITWAGGAVPAALRRRAPRRWSTSRCRCSAR